MQTKQIKIKLHKKTSKEIFEFCFNIMLSLLGILGLIFLFTIAIPREGGKSSVANYTTFKFFTTDSNILLLVSSLIEIVIMILIWKNKIKNKPLWVYVIKHTTTLSVTLTMFITIFILLPGAIWTASYPPSSLFLGSNLFFHLINPLVAIITFLLFENRKDIKFKHVCWSLITLGIYSIFYITVAYTHVKSDGTIPIDYDWYKFCSFGPIATPFILIGIYGIYFLFAWLLWMLNRKIDIFKKEALY